MVIADALDQLCVDLTTAGIHATQDPRELNPPCAWVMPREATSTTLAGGVVLAVDVWLIVGDHGYTRATRALSGLWDTASSLLDIVDTSFADGVTLPAGGGPLPAWRISTTIQIC